MFRYFGPPGTGKTPTLLNQVDALLSQGMSSNEIGYFAFTRASAHEARDRAVARFNLDPKKDFQYFRTLHSLAFKVLGMTSAQILNDQNLKSFGAETGIDLTSKGAEHIVEDGFVVMKSNNPIMRAIDLARNSLQGHRHAYNETSLHIPFYEYKHIYDEYERFKVLNGLKDFTDMMVELSEKPSVLPLWKTVFLDEAQDLTPLQWRVAHSLNDRSERMFVAGDDDQGIYRWIGADINHFVALEGGSEVLSKSYRVPRKIHALADSVAQRIRSRQKKVWFPRDAEGSVQRIYDSSMMTFERDEEWLILAQANFMLDGIAERLISDGHYFERKGNPSLSKDVRDAISTWGHLVQDPGHEISLKEAINLYDHISSKEGSLKRGAKKMLGSADEQDVFSISVLRDYFGLETPNCDWDEALDRISDEDRVYATALLNRNVNIFEEPKIKLSTIHGSKGREADNVLLYTSLSGAAMREMERNPDDAHRVLYVGITRARQNLVLKLADDSQLGWTI